MNELSTKNYLMVLIGSGFSGLVLLLLGYTIVGILLECVAVLALVGILNKRDKDVNRKKN